MNPFSPLLALLLGLSSIHIQAAECDNPRPLRFAQVPQRNAEQMTALFRPLYRRLEQVLERPVEIVPAASYSAVVEGLHDSRIDVAELGPAAYVAAIKQGAKIVAFTSFSGQQSEHFDLTSGYQSVLISRADRPLDSLEKLQGTTVALTDPASTSGALYPRHFVRQLTGQPLERHFRRVTYAGSHDRAIEAVQRGDADAAFVTSTRLDEFYRRGAAQPGEFRIIWTSESIPFDPFVYRSKLCAPLAQKIRQAFLKDQESMKLLFDAMKRPGFIPVGDERFQGVRAVYESLAND